MSAQDRAGGARGADREVPAYLRRLGEEADEAATPGTELRAALRGDCHLHSDRPTAAARC
ncbi:hypothetical protein GCM10010286_54120 [Streptomyces toxytricini]|nr:hypothetical protein GCM10010286_54120 [Streptomyces toxytricini]